MRKRIVLRVAALAIVLGSYVILLFVVAPILLTILTMTDTPQFHEVVLKEDRTVAGIRFPKGSTLSTYPGVWPWDGDPHSLVLSTDIEINGIPAGKGTTVEFGWEDSLHAYRVGQLTTGRGWTYRGISVPAGSRISLRADDIWYIELSRGTGIKMDFGSSPSDLAPTRLEDRSQASLAIKLSKEVDGMPVLGEPFMVHSYSPNEQMMEFVLARPIDRDGYKLAAGSRVRVFYGKFINGERQGFKVVMGTLREDSVLSGVAWPKGVTFLQLVGAAETGASFQYQVPGGVVLQVEDMLIQGPSILEFDGDTLRSVLGHYVWRGDQYKS